MRSPRLNHVVANVKPATATAIPRRIQAVFTGDALFLIVRTLGRRHTAGSQAPETTPSVQSISPSASHCPRLNTFGVRPGVASEFAWDAALTSMSKGTSTPASPTPGDQRTDDRRQDAKVGEHSQNNRS